MLWKTVLHKKLLIYFFKCCIRYFAHGPFLAKFINRRIITVKHYLKDDLNVQYSLRTIKTEFIESTLFFLLTDHMMQHYADIQSVISFSFFSCSTCHIHNEQTPKQIGFFAKKHSDHPVWNDFGIWFRLCNIIVLICIIFISFHIIPIYERFNSLFQICRLKNFFYNYIIQYI